MLEPFAVQVGLMHVVDRAGGCWTSVSAPIRRNTYWTRKAASSRPKPTPSLGWTLRARYYPRDDATASFIYQTLGKPKEDYIR